jgi:hypothetical protein
MPKVAQLFLNNPGTTIKKTPGYQGSLFLTVFLFQTTHNSERKPKTTYPLFLPSFPPSFLPSFLSFVFFRASKNLHLL